MPNYKIYIVDGRNHITNAHDYVGTDDMSAFHRANILRAGDAAEIWQSTRLVSRIPKGGEADAVTR
jgi:hypothetical protein